MIPKHQVRRLPMVEEDGKLVCVVALVDVACARDDGATSRPVEEISE
jgi:CBS-domain-containing membrane protein